MPRPRDARRIAHIEAAAWRMAYRGLIPDHELRQLGTEERVYRWMHRIRDPTQGPLVGVARLDGLIAGYVTHGPSRSRDLESGFAGEIYELYVHPALHRRGVGRTLLAGAFGAMRTASYRWAVLEVLRDNHGARAFYASMGMQTEEHARRRSSGLASRFSRGRRYSRPRAGVWVVRYECPLYDVTW